MKVWGDLPTGGCDSSHTPTGTYYTCMPSGLTDVVKVFINSDGGAAALKSDGSVKTWGIKNKGGADPGITSGVVDISKTLYAFAALKSDGSVKAWGFSSYGGADPGITSGVTKIFNHHYAFAALKSDGSVQVWGDSGYGGCDSSHTPTNTNYMPSGLTNVVKVFGSGGAFAA